jgi:hypothetical protein
MKKTMSRQKLCLTPQQVSWLRRESGKMQVTISEFLRRILDKEMGK